MSSASGSGFTAAQQAAIAASGNVLVVAGAGTGKTRTLIERTLRLVREGASLDRLLLVTFTQAAASEMKIRLRAGLERLSEEHPDNLHFLEQLALLDTALIGTLHSFCLDLIRDHFHELAIDPLVIVLDDHQIQPLIENSFDSVLTPLFSESSATAQATQSFLRKWAGDAPLELRALVLRIYRYGLSLPDPRGWFEAQQRCFEEPTPQLWRSWLVSEFVVWRSEWLPELERYRGNENVLACLKALEPIASVSPSFSVVREALLAIRLADEEIPWQRGSKGKVRDPLKRFFDEAGFFASQFVSPSAGDAEDPLQCDWDRVRSEMLVLLLLIRRFDDEFARAKREMGGVDFSDLEQLSLRLLWDVNGKPSAAALESRKRFDHVFVDEVQDINAAQDAILRAVSREGDEANRFLVGDMKQSIYRFRLANPSIFRAYQQAWQSTPSQGQVIALSDNFRSRESLLETVNSMFGILMRPELGGVSYDAQARLRFGNSEGRPLLRHLDARPHVELRVFLKSDEGDVGDEAADAIADLPRMEQEARWIAHRLRALKEAGHPVWDDTLQGFRSVRWSDMVVLLRAPEAKSESFAKEFHAAGIPLVASRGGFFSSQEIQDLLSLLKLLDNPLQDIPLLAVLRSPLVGVSLEELTWIRAADRRQLLWTALVQGIHATDQPGSTFKFPEALQSKLKAFVANCALWREGVRLGSLSSCLETILADTRYEVLLEAEPRGAIRVTNLHRLLDLTRQFDPYQRQGLFRFLRFVEAQQEADQDLEPAPGRVDDAVQLMSVHKSKGLEFPIVVVADLGKRFNTRDLREDILLDEQLGLCARVWLPESRQKYPSVAHWLAARRGRLELLGEELRLLYVAFTRAKDRLIIAGQGRESQWQPPEADADQDPNTESKDSKLSQATTAMDWIHHWFSSVAQPKDWINDFEGQNQLVAWSVGPVVALDPVVPDGASAAEGSSPDTAEASALDVEAVVQRVTWQYPKRAATREPVKTAVSVLRRRWKELAEESQPLLRTSPDRFRVKSSGVREGLSAADRGTIHHQFLQWLDLGRAESQLDLRNEAERLLQEGAMSEQEVGCLDFNALTDFWQSEVGREIRKHRDLIHRELPFTASLSARELQTLGIQPKEGALDSSEFIVVQGQIDLAVIQPEEIWLLDYKTDTVSAEELSGRAEQYRVQVQIYALALEKVYRRPVTRRWLHFITPGMTVTLDS